MAISVAASAGQNLPHNTAIPIADAVGDVILAIASSDGAGKTLIMPVGFSDTGIGVMSQGSPDGETGWGIILPNSAGAGTYVIGDATGDNLAIGMIAIRGADTANPINAISAAPTVVSTGEPTPVTITVPGITTTTGGCLVVLCVSLDATRTAGITWDSTGWDGVVSDGATNWAHVAMLWRIQTAAGPTGSLVCVAAGSSAGYSAYAIAIAPPGGGGQVVTLPGYALAPGSQSGGATALANLVGRSLQDPQVAGDSASRVGLSGGALQSMGGATPPASIGALIARSDSPSRVSGEAASRSDQIGRAAVADPIITPIPQSIGTLVGYAGAPGYGLANPLVYVVVERTGYASAPQMGSAIISAIGSMIGRASEGAIDTAYASAVVAARGWIAVESRVLGRSGRGSTPPLNFRDYQAVTVIDRDPAIVVGIESTD